MAFPLDVVPAKGRSKLAYGIDTDVIPVRTQPPVITKLMKTYIREKE